MNKTLLLMVGTMMVGSIAFCYDVTRQQQQQQQQQHTMPSMFVTGWQFKQKSRYQPQYRDGNQNIQQQKQQQRRRSNQSYTSSSISSYNNANGGGTNNNDDTTTQPISFSSSSDRKAAVDVSIVPAIKQDRRSFVSSILATTTAAILWNPPTVANAQIDVSGLRVVPINQLEQSIATPRSIGPPVSSTIIRNDDDTKETSFTSSSSSSSTRNDNKKQKDIQSIELAGISYTPAAMVLQLAEQTASMEGMLRYSIRDIQDGKSVQQRIENGSKGIGPGAIRRQDLIQSIQIMIKNSQLQSIAPTATTILEEIPIFLNKSTNGSNTNTNTMSIMEYQIVANKYEQARDALKQVFDTYPIETQNDGKVFMRKLRAKDEAENNN